MGWLLRDATIVPLLNAAWLDRGEEGGDLT